MNQTVNHEAMAREILKAWYVLNTDFTDPWVALVAGYALGMLSRIKNTADPTVRAQIYGAGIGMLFSLRFITMTEFEASAREERRPIFTFEAGNKIAEKEKLTTM